MRFLAILVLASSCLATSAQTETQPPLIALVAEKISVDSVSSPKDVRNFYYTARYRVVKIVHGEVDREIIEFSGADHLFSPPQFAHYRCALLFFARIGDKYIHIDGFTWAPVYRTKSGRWAGPYFSADYMFYHENVDKPVIKPESIEFPEEATRIVEEWELEDFPLEQWEPYWRLRGNRLVPLQGNYLEDLIELKKLAWRSHFE